MILDRYRQAVRNCLVHGVPVDFAAEGLIGFRDRGSGKAHEGRLRESLLQNLCIWLGNHSLHVVVHILAETNLFGVFQLCPMRFIGKADDVGTIIDQTNLVIFPVAEFLNGADIETTALASAQFLPQCLPARDNAHLAQIQKLLAFGEQFGPLLLEFLPVHDHHNGGRADLRHIRAAQSQLPGEKCHGIGFAATGSPEVRSAFTAFFHHRLDDTLLQKTRSKKLRIPADDFPFVAVVFAVLKIDIVAEDFQESTGAVHAFDHGLHLVKRKSRDLVFVVHPAPGIKMLIRRTHRAQSGLDPIGDAGQRAVVQQMRNVPPVTDINLFPRIIDGGRLIRRVFQLYNAQRHTVDIK